MQKITAGDTFTIPYFLQQWKSSLRFETRRPPNLAIEQANPHLDRDKNSFDDARPTSAITSR
jgi:hypothetical protein